MAAPQLKNKTRKKPAAITLITVLILSFAALAIALTLLSVNINSNLSTNAVLHGSEAATDADTCAEIALDKLKSNANYTGNETLTLTYGSCQILNITGSGNVNRIIQTIGISGEFTQRSQVVVNQVNPDTQIFSWQHLANF